MADLPPGVQAQVKAWEQRMRASGCTAATVRTRTTAVRSFVTSGGDALAPDADAIIGWLAGQGAQWTRLTYHSALTCWVGHLHAAGVLEEGTDPMRWVKRPRTPKVQPHAIPDSDLGLLLGAASGRTRAYLLLGAFAGLRVSEMARMRGELVTSRSIRVVGKGGREDHVPTHPVVWQLAQGMPRRGWWFESPARTGHVASTSVSTALRRLMDDVGVDATAHHLRHSFATRLLYSGVDVRVVQVAMRHASLSATEHYLQVDDVRLHDGVRGLTLPNAA